MISHLQMSMAPFQGTVLQCFTQESVNHQTVTITVLKSCKYLQPPLAIIGSLSAPGVEGVSSLPAFVQLGAAHPLAAGFCLSFCP